MPLFANLVLVLVIFVVIFAMVSRGLRRTESAPVGARPVSPAPQIESPEAYRNHLAMARWIELQLKDDLVRSSVPEPEQARARRLLGDFYGEDG